MKRYFFGLLSAVLVINVASLANAAIETETKLTMPTPKNALHSAATSVSCISTINCIAVGYQEVFFSKFISSAKVKQSLVMSWNGKRWAIVPSPNLGLNESNVLNSVSCTSTGYCKATGVWLQKVQKTDRLDEFIERPLAMSWDGSTWTLDPTSSVPDFAVFLDVACVSQFSCFAVGSQWVNKTPTSSRDSYLLPMIWQWDGASWTQQVFPSATDSSVFGISEVRSISCVSSSVCVAVGYFFNPVSKTQQTTSLVWNGTDWVWHLPSLLLDRPFLEDVSCSSEKFCMAVGKWGTTSTTSAVQNFSLTWDGISWSQLTTPTVSPFRGNVLSSVSCRAPNECVAVGYSESDLTPLMSLVWDGRAWSMVQAPKDEKSSLWRSVSCASSSFCIAVGGPFPEIPGNPVSVFLGPFHMKSKVKKTLTSSSLAKAGKLSTPKGSKIKLSTSVKHRKICKVVRNTIKTVGKGTCPVTVVVTLKNKKKTTTTLSIKVF